MLGEVAHTPRIGQFDKELGLRSCDSDLPRGQLEMVAELIGHLEHQLDWAALASVVHGRIATANEGSSAHMTFLGVSKYNAWIAQSYPERKAFMYASYAVVAVVLALGLIASGALKLIKQPKIIDGIHALGVSLKLFPVLATLEIAGLWAWSPACGSLRSASHPQPA
jgi:hypothetical protein